MRISLLAALAAATALVPVAAQAQNRQDQGDWHRGRSDHAQARPQGAPARVAPARPQFDRGPQANVARPQAGDWQNRGDRGNWQNRADAGNWQGRGNRPQVPQAQPGGGNWHESVGGDRGQADWHGRDAGNGGSWHQSVGGDRNRSDWHGRDDANRGSWQQGRDNHRDGDRGNDWNRGNDRNHSDQAWRDHDRYSDRFHGNQAFNHDWRRDNRYDWRDYRARNRAIYHLPRYYAPYGWGYGYRRFGVGFTLNSVLFGPNYWIGDPWAYRLPPAYGPYRWVRYYDDALLVDIRTGYVVDVVYDIFW